MRRGVFRAKNESEVGWFSGDFRSVLCGNGFLGLSKTYGFFTAVGSWRDGFNHCGSPPSRRKVVPYFRKMRFPKKERTTTKKKTNLWLLEKLTPAALLCGGWKGNWVFTTTFLLLIFILSLSFSHFSSPLPSCTTISTGPNLPRRIFIIKLSLCSSGWNWKTKFNIPEHVIDQGK